MNQIHIVEDSKGTYSCEIGVSVDEWQELLSDWDLTTPNYRYALMAFYNAPEHKSSCKKLSQQYYGNDKDAQKFNSWITNYGKAVVKRLNRFHIVDTDGSERYWHVAMCQGRTTEEGLFEWKLRPEIVQAIKNLGWTMHFTWIPFYMEMADKLLSYKNKRKELLDIVYGLERVYTNHIRTEDKNRVQDIDPFTVIGIFNRGHTFENRSKICGYFKDKLDISADIPVEFDGVPVLMMLKSNFFYRDKINTDIQPLWDLFESVLTKDESLFSKCFDIVCKQKGIKWNITMGLYWVRPYDYISLDSRNRSYLLTLGIDVFDNADLNSDNYLKLLQKVRDKINARQIKAKSIPDISYRAWMHDVGQNEEIEDMKTMQNNKYQKYINLLDTNKNLILTGAPGTGKTHLAKEMAALIMFGKYYEDLLDGEKNSIGFVQFHPSYDYTDFVEGLRPKSGESDQVVFERRDGVFKEFCRKALLSSKVVKSTLEELNENPVVWKVSLMGTGNNPVRTDCLNNGYIRIGWSEYGDIEDFDDYQNFNSGGRNVLRAFQNVMKEGDIVVSCFSAKEVDAVGIVTGEYEYHKDGEHYPRYRKVRWLAKNIKEDIVAINGGKHFTLSTVYKSAISVEDALNIVKKHNPSIMYSEEAIRPFVFIIDEINRGEISKIFGELFYAVDPGYRGVSGRVNTQYQNLIPDGDTFKKGFYVPENVYIIGTMNDIDRSVESMDFAMRRRFAWQEVTAEESYANMIENVPDFANVKDEIKARMFNLNKAIAKTEGLDEAYQIGAAYFRKYLDYQDNANPFDCIWENHLKGLLYEYLRGNRKAKELLENLHKAYNKTSIDE